MVDPWAVTSQAPTTANADPWAVVSSTDPTAMANSELAKHGIQVSVMPKPPAVAMKPTSAVEGALSNADTAASSDPVLRTLSAGTDFSNDVTTGVAKGAGKTLLGLDNILRHGLNKIGGHYADVDESNFGGKKGDLETHGIGEGVGDIGENVAEFFTGEELLGILGKGAKSLKGASQLAEFMAKYPRVAKLMHLGVSAAKQAAITGGQTYVKTGGDEDAAKEAATIAGVTGLSIEGAAALVKKGLRYVTPALERVGGRDLAVPREAQDLKPTPQQAALQDEFRQTAQDAARPALEDINAARAEQPQVTENEKAIITERGPKTSTTPKINIGEHLDRVNDFSSAADLVREQANAIYDHADEVTGGKFRQVLKEVDNGVEDAPARMEELIDSMKGQIPKEEIAAARTSFRRMYTLRTISKTLDASLSGVPGSSARANAYRGIDGNKLMGGLNRLVRQMGRGSVENAIGATRLKNLEELADLNRTNVQRQRFGAAVNNVAKYLPSIGSHVSAGTVGAVVGHHFGVPYEAGFVAGYAGAGAVEKVMKAVTANPKIGQFLTYAIDSGARPEHYAPMLGTMIQRLETESANEKKEDKQQ